MTTLFARAGISLVIALGWERFFFAGLAASFYNGCQSMGSTKGLCADMDAFHLTGLEYLGLGGLLVLTALLVIGVIAQGPKRVEVVRFICLGSFICFSGGWFLASAIDYMNYGLAALM